MHRLLACSLVFLFAVRADSAASRKDRYALFLSDQPLAAAAAQAKKDGARLASEDHLQRIHASQQTLRQTLAQQKIQVLGSTQTVMNAVYVFAPGRTLAELRALPGVVRVQRMRPVRRQMNRALDIVNARNAWTQVGGMQNAGAGVKIAILDTGIDDKHPAFQDASLAIPAGYPKCSAATCPYTNNKIIASRSYVGWLVLPDRPEISRPDDLSPRDRVGHGTAAAMIAAGVETQSPAGLVSGVAPKAQLGNYKIFGSPGVNGDFTFDDVIAMALEDAQDDGMNIAVLAIGRPADWGPTDSGATCNVSGDDPCDFWADLVENASSAGLAVAVAAGNDGDLAIRFPSLNSIYTPGTAPSALTVGAITNSHDFFASLQTTGNGVPQELSRIPAFMGDGPKLSSALTAPMRVVGAPNQTACEPIAAGSLAGTIALVELGDCAFATKVNNAQKAGAVAAVIMLTGSSDFIFPITGLEPTGIPAAVISGRHSTALRTFLGSNANRPGTLSPQLDEVTEEANTVAYFSSRGPGIGLNHIKPEVAAPGVGLYVATQSYDPNGRMWSPNGYTSVQGTSFAAAMAAGAAALVKQSFPSYGVPQLKSAVVNTAGDSLDDFDESGARIRASVTAVGAGRLNVAEAVKASVTADPATISFGVVASTGGLPSQQITLRNAGTSAANLTIQVQPADSRVQLSAGSLTVAAGGSQQLTVRVTQVPPSGSYEGFVVITGGGATLRLPYLYLRGDDVPFSIMPIEGFDFLGRAGETLGECDNPDEGAIGTLLLYKVVDRFGVPVAGIPVQVSPSNQVVDATEGTDDLGIGCAGVFLGDNPGEELFTIETLEGPDLAFGFPGRSRKVPAINQGGVVNAASGQAGQGLAPGSYVSIFGQNLSEALRVFNTSYLPISLADVSVSFDVPDRLISVPGRIHFVSESQINVQIPWELRDLSNARMKVAIGPFLESAVYSLPLRTHSPAFIENPPGTVAALDEANLVISAANPVQRGRVAQMYANGLGPVDNTPPSGEPTPLQLVNTVDRPTVTVGGVNANVLFSGLAPGYIALNQVNIVVPESLQAGAHDVVLTIGGVSSKPVRINVR